MRVFANRASKILYDFILSNKRTGYWLIPSNACSVVPLVFYTAKIPFKFVDINLDTLCMDSKSIEKHASNSDCIGVLFIYTYGIEKNFDSLFKKIKSINDDLIIIEDKCLNYPKFFYKSLSKYTDFGLYSTGYGKFCDMGYGGYGLLKNYELKYIWHDTQFTLDYFYSYNNLFNYCVKNKILPPKPCTNWLDDRKLPQNYKKYVFKVKVKSILIIIKKKILNKIYKTFLTKNLWLTVDNKVVDNWRFNIQFQSDSKLAIDCLFNKGLFASKHYYPSDLIFGPNCNQDSNAYFLYKRVLNLFNDNYYSIFKGLKTCYLLNKINYE